jgi:hypothetical protein
MSKSSMVASTIPKNPIYYGNGDTYMVKEFLDL